MVLGNYYTEKLDIWSLGTIYYELLFGNIPGVGKTDKERINNIRINGI
jgi:serine/threonine protein kinase